MIESGTGSGYHASRLTTSPAVKHTKIESNRIRASGKLTKSDRNQTLNKASYYYNISAGTKEHEAQFEMVERDTTR